MEKVSVTLPLEGMESEHCAMIIDKALAKTNGVLQHKVELNNKQAIVEIDADITSISSLVTAIRDVGYNVPTVVKAYPVTGMTCASCANSVQSMSKSQNGVLDANVNFADASLQVTFIPGVITPEQLKATVQSIGYDLIIDEENSQTLKEEAEALRYNQLKTQFIWASALSLPIVVIGMFFREMHYANYIMMALAMPVLFWFGKSYFINAWKQALHGSANMDTLVALSTGVAFLFSVFNTLNPQFWTSRGLQPDVYFEAAAVVIAFISLGKLLEEKAKSNTSSAIKKLIGLQPKTVRIVADGQEKEIPIAQVQIGNEIMVKPGEKIAVDGVVVSGSTYIDESMITGEPVAVLKEAGAKVFAGTINQKGAVHFKAEKVGSDTLLAQIIKMVQQAQGSKAPVQKLVDKISGIFVPVVMGIAILTFIVWMLSGGQNALTHALLTSVTVLVIACPCALGLATPTAIMVGVGKGAENNILIKDAESLELAYKVDAIILDKTGTITEGKPSVTNMEWDAAATTEEKQIFFSMENKSEHPLAGAVVNYLKESKLPLVAFTQYESITGKGVEAMYNNTKYWVGSPAFIVEKGIIITDNIKQLEKEWQEAANTVIYFFSEKRVIGIVAIADKIKATSKQAIETLQSRGIEVYMLTGDNPQTAEAVAKQVGIQRFKGGTLPADKAAFIIELQQKDKVVAMVGDGINDSHALAQADVSIAMGKGSDIAIDVAKMTLLTSDLNTIPKALLLSKKTMATIKQNLFWAFVYNLIGIPIAAGALYPVNGFLLNPMLAGAAMALSSVSVVGNSLRLKFSNIGV
ncbi:heavy metal translocating P-type ATPase [Parasediminibacterium sp. JCM 36343]|uniref:heavy metal translocating P-type ATPase n=1 Tax=Parasediminibacterium sp. JCM 36343 TaxID=3374279 RepID=UPI00397DDA47